MSDIGDDNPFKIYPLSEMPVSSDLHRDFTEEELIEKMDFVPPEHHCLTRIAEWMQQFTPFPFLHFNFYYNG